jgi:uncharacterized protein (TIGR00304 family)
MSLKPENNDVIGLLKSTDESSIERSLQPGVDINTLYTLGTAFIIIGIIMIVVVALLILLKKTKRQGKTEAAGVTMIEPIPIVFGTDKEAIKTILILALVLTIILVIPTILSHLLAK